MSIKKVKGPKVSITKVKPAAVIPQPQAAPVIKPKGVTRRLGVQGIASLGFVAASVGVAGYRHTDGSAILEKFLGFFQGGTPSEQTPPAIMFVLDPKGKLTNPQGQAASSMIIREWCDKVGVEYRRYRFDADLFQEDKWVRNCQSVGREFGAPCLVIVDKDGRGRAVAIPQGVEPTIRLLEASFNV